MSVVLVIDAANVVGARPDGWWRDRAGATARLLDRLVQLPGAHIVGPDGEPVTCSQVVVVVEGAAREVPAPEPLRLVRAPGSGDDAIAATAAEAVTGGGSVLVVTADRGLRARLPDAAVVAGPRWLLEVLDRMAGE